MKNFLGIIVLFIFQSCSVFSVREKIELKGVSKSEAYKRAYSHHLTSAVEELARINKKDISKIPDLGKFEYINEIVHLLKSQNELLFSKLPPISFYLLKSEGPIYFSLPGGQIFFSQGLLKKYLKNEELFVSLIAFEMMKINYSAYLKRELFPTGVYEISNFIDINKIDTSEKIELYKWSYYALKRSGFNPNSILNLIQLQNRNSLDFVLMSGSVQDFSKEEFAVKSFLVSQGLDNKNLKIKNSGTDFYNFINSIVNYK